MIFSLEDCYCPTLFHVSSRAPSHNPSGFGAQSCNRGTPKTINRGPSALNWGSSAALSAPYCYAPSAPPTVVPTVPQLLLNHQC